MSIRHLATAAARTGDEVRWCANVASHAERLLSDLGDQPGARAIHAASRALEAPTVTLVVAGEFRQGKSSLINAILGARVSPVEPLATTSVPIRIAAGPRTILRAHVAGSDDPARAWRPVGEDDLDRLATAARPELGGQVVDSLEVDLPHPVLDAGLAFVDTPCVSGGLATQAAGIVLGLLTGAQALVFVTDASQELTAPELEFLRMAHSLCPTVLLALTKVDLYPEWRRILDIDQERLSSIDPDAVVLPVSPQLRASAVRWGDPDLDRESGLPLLTWYLGTTLGARARQAALHHCGRLLDSHLTGATAILEQRLAAVEEGSAGHDTEDRLARSIARLESLRADGPRRVRLELRALVRSVSADLTARFTAAYQLVAELIGAGDPAERWPEVEATLHRATNRALAEHLGHVRAQVAEVLARLEETFGLDRDSLAFELQEFSAAPELASGVDEPDFSAKRAGRVHDAVRGGVSTGFMGVGLATTILTGGLMVLALGAGASLSTVALSLRRERTREVEGRRARALQACKAAVSSARDAAGTFADEIHKELEFQLETHLERRLQHLLHEGEAEGARLAELRRVAADRVPDAAREIRRLLEEVQVVHGHARRLEHRLARPELEVAVR